MRGLLCVLILIWAGAVAYAQPGPDIVWSHPYDNGQTDWLGAVVPLSDGGFAACGSSMRSGSGADGWLVKTNGDGQLVWNRYFGGTAQDELRRLAPTSDGGFILCGMTRSSGNGEMDAYVVKTNGDGQVIWTHTYGGAGDDYAWDIRQLADGGYLFCGETSSSGAGGSDGWLVKLNGEGVQQWAHTFGGAGTDLFYSMDLAAEGSCYLGGYTTSWGSGMWDVYAVKVNAAGNAVWTNTYGGSNRDYAESVATTLDGGVVIGGVTRSTGTDYSNAYVVKLTAQGSTEWTRAYGGGQEDAILDITQLPDGSYLWSGETGVHPFDGLIYRLNPQGEPLWSRVFHNDGETWLLDGRLTANHGFIFAGSIGSDGLLMRLAPEQNVPEHHFASVPPTGLPYAVIVDSARAGDALLIGGDEIGIFDGDLCVGMATVGPWPLSITTWQGDSAHHFAGFTPGHVMQFRMWRHAEDREIAAIATLTTGDGNFGTGVYSRCSLSSLASQQVIPLRANVSHLISLRVWPSAPTAAAVLGTLPSLVAAYQDNGGVFIPPAVNTIGELSPFAAYRVFCTDTETLRVNGNPVNAHQEYHLSAGAWHWISNPLPAAADVTVALGAISDRLVIIQDDDGHAWIPSQGINTLGSLAPGKGYMLIVNQEVSFTFNPGTAVLSLPAPGLSAIVPPDAPPSTGLPYQVIVRLGDNIRQQASTVSLFDGDLCVGKAYVPQSDAPFLVTTWQGIEEYDVHGFVPGHSIRAIVNGADGHTITALETSAAATFGAGAFAEMNLDANGVATATAFRVGEGYPNPFNPTVTIPFTLLEAGPVEVRIFNALGQSVYRIRRDYTAGDHTFAFDHTALTRTPVSGVYFVELRHFEFREVRKVLLMR